MSERKVKTLYWARIPQFDLSNCAELGASLEQRTHKTVMLQSHFVIRHSVRDDEGLRSSHRYEQLPQRHKPIAFDAEGLRLALCFAFSCGIQVEPVYAPRRSASCEQRTGWGKNQCTHKPTQTVGQEKKPTVNLVF